MLIRVTPSGHWITPVVKVGPTCTYNVRIPAGSQSTLRSRAPIQRPNRNFYDGLVDDYVDDNL